MAKNTPYMFKVEPKTITAIIIDIGCRLTASEKRSGTNMFPPNN